MNPDVTITIGRAASPDHTLVWAVVIPQLVAIAIFIGQAWFNHRRDRDKRARDMKRDVLLEVAPALQRLYASLGELINPSARIDAFAERLTSTSGAVAKLQAVASDETLEAARKLMTALGTIMMRLMAKRVEVGTDLEAAKQLVELWRKEIDVIPDLLADFSAKARSEIPLPIDKKLLRDGFKASGETMFEEMENVLRVLTEQQNGATRESQAGRANRQDEQAAGKMPVAPEQAQDTATQLVALRQLATFWEYRYLNMFLVHRTQVVLNWLIDRQATGQSTNIGYYDAELTARVVSPAERAAVLKALEAHALVVINGGLLAVTDKGLDYAHWRGPLPQLSATP
jgi:hypothetical protein